MLKLWTALTLLFVAFTAWPDEVVFTVLKDSPTLYWQKQFPVFELVIEGETLLTPFSELPESENMVPETAAECCKRLLRAVAERNKRLWTEIIAPEDVRNADGTVPEDFTFEDLDENSRAFYQNKAQEEPYTVEPVLYGTYEVGRYDIVMVTEAASPSWSSKKSFLFEEFREGKFRYAAERVLDYFLSAFALNARPGKLERLQDWPGSSFSLPLRGLWGAEKNIPILRLCGAFADEADTKPFTSILTYIKRLNAAALAVPQEEDPLASQEWAALLKLVAKDSHGYLLRLINSAGAWETKWKSEPVFLIAGEGYHLVYMLHPAQDCQEDLRYYWEISEEDGQLKLSGMNDIDNVDAVFRKDAVLECVKDLLCNHESE